MPRIELATDHVRTGAAAVAAAAAARARRRELFGPALVTAPTPIAVVVAVVPDPELAPPAPPIPTPQRFARTVIAQAAFYFDIRLADVMDGRRTADRLHARHVAAHVLRTVGWSYPRIGRALGVDHSTAIHQFRRVKADPDLLAASGHVLARARRKLGMPETTEEGSN